MGFKETRGDLPQTDMGWEVYPEGLAFFIRRLAKDYAPGLPIYITENGMARVDTLEQGGASPSCHDPERVAYYAEHLGVVKGLIDEGLPVAGYFAWSLLDNFEWARGYAKRFGLIHVDYPSQSRTPKSSYHAFRKALMERRG